MMNLSNKIRMMIIKVVNRLGNHPNLLNEKNKIRMMVIITLMMLSYFGDVQEGTQLVRKFLVVVVMTMMVMEMIQMKINLPNILNLSNLPLRKIYTVIILYTSRNNPIRPIFKLPKGGRKLVECLPIISKKIGKFGIAELVQLGCHYRIG